MSSLILLDYKKALFEFSFINTIVGNKLLGQSWYDEIIPGKLTLSAMPFVEHVHEFYQKGVGFVLTTLEPYEWNQPNCFGIPAKFSDWNKVGIQHEIIDTPDFKPLSIENILAGVEHLRHAIQENNLHAVVHCKAGRGRSATIVVCYLLKYGEFHGIPKFNNIYDAINYVTARRPVISLNAKQRQAIVIFHNTTSLYMETLCSSRDNISAEKNIKQSIVEVPDFYIQH